MQNRSAPFGAIGAAPAQAASPFAGASQTSAAPTAGGALSIEGISSLGKRATWSPSTGGSRSGGEEDPTQPLRPSLPRPHSFATTRGSMSSGGEEDPAPLRPSMVRPQSFTSTLSSSSSRSPDLSRVPSVLSNSSMSPEGDPMAAGRGGGMQQPLGDFASQHNAVPFFQPFESQPASQQQHERPRPPVHVVFDTAAVPFPLALPPAYALERVLKIAASYGSIASFKCFSFAPIMDGQTEGGLSPLVKAAIRDAGIELVEVASTTTAVGMELSVTFELMRLLTLHTTSSTLILLSNQEVLAHPLHLLRQSKQFEMIVVIYHSGVGAINAPLLPMPSEPAALIRASSVALEWSQLLRQGLPDSFGSLLLEPPRNVPARFDQRNRSGGGGGRSSDRRITDGNMSPFGSRTHTPIPRPPSVMQQSYASQSLNPSPFASTIHSGAGSRDPSFPSSMFSSAASSRRSSISSAPMVVAPPDANGREAMGGVIVVPQWAESQSDSNSIQDLSLELLREPVRSHVLAFISVLQYTEKEKMIPREGMLRKRLQDALLSNGAIPSIDFESLLHISSEHGIVKIEGEAPQRIIYPAGAGGDARKYECADFFKPESRLTIEQSIDVLMWLSASNPIVGRGRFGFSQHMSMHAPSSIKALSHGMLVELVQLLLNQKILLFRKGQVAVNHNLQAVNLHALAALSITAPPHTALLSTAKGMQGQHETEVLMQRFTGLETSAAGWRSEPNGQFGAVSGQSALPPPHHHLQQQQQQQTAMRMRRNSTGQVSFAPLQPNGSSQHGYPMSAPGSPTAQLRAQSYMNQIEQHLAVERSGIPGQAPQLEPVAPPFAPAPLFAPLAVAPRPFRATPASIKTVDVSYLDLLAHKLLCAKWGPIPMAVATAGTHKFPFAALWHADFSTLCEVGSKRASWSATCSFDVNAGLHTFSSQDSYESQTDAMEGLAQTILRNDVIWSLTQCCVMQELKSARRASSAQPTKRVMALLLKSKVDLSELERDELDLHGRTQAQVHAQLASNPVLFLDYLLASQQQPPMVYSCEQAALRSTRGTRMLWSVAAKLPAAMLADTMLGSLMATSVKEAKLDAKAECATLMLRQINPALLVGSAWSEVNASPSEAAGASSAPPSVAIDPSLPVSSAASSSSSWSSSSSSSSRRARLSAHALAWIPPSDLAQMDPPVMQRTESNSSQAAETEAPLSSTRAPSTDASSLVPTEQQ